MILLMLLQGLQVGWRAVEIGVELREPPGGAGGVPDEMPPDGGAEAAALAMAGGNGIAEFYGDVVKHGDGWELMVDGGEEGRVTDSRSRRAEIAAASGLDDPADVAAGFAGREAGR
jgi:hypothetical protein